MKEVPSRRPLVEQTVADRVIAYFDPVRGVQRARARATMAVAGAWFAGRKDRRATQEWTPNGGSADADNLFDLDTVRQRSRDLIRNNPLACGAINTVVTSAVGTGLALSARPDAEVLGWTEDQAAEWARTVENEFRAWAENPVACDASKTLDLYGLQSLAMRTALEAGDALALLPMLETQASPYALKVLLVENDRLVNKDRARDTDELAGGVQMDRYGAPTHYHFLKRHPGSLNPGRGEWDIVRAFGQKTGRRNVIHLFERRRPGQSRGFPYLAPVVEALKQLGNYTEAEIMAAVISGMFTVFVETTSGQGLNVGDTTGATGTAAGDSIKLGNGAIIDLASGEKVTTANPNRPNTAFDPFVQAILRQVGVALEIPFELLVKHFTASYSAARAALLEAWRFFRVKRAWLAAGFCQPIYEAWMDEAVALGRVDAPGYFDDPSLRAAYLGTEWIGDAPGQIDPLKEVQAARERINGRLSNHAIETMAIHGMQWPEVHRTLAKEMEQSKAAGTMQEPAAKKPGENDDEDDPDKPDEEEKALLREAVNCLKSGD